MTAWPGLYVSNTIAASPAGAAETVIGQVNVTTDAATAVAFLGVVAFTVGTSGTAGRLRIRADSLTGTVVADSGAVTMTAANLVSLVCGNVLSGPELPARLFVATLTVTAGAATSTVSNLLLMAIAQF